MTEDEKNKLKEYQKTTGWEKKINIMCLWSVRANGKSLMTLRLTKRSFMLLSNQLVYIYCIRVVAASKLEHVVKSFKYFIGYSDDNIIRPLCIKLPEMCGFKKYFK